MKTDTYPTIPWMPVSTTSGVLRLKPDVSTQRSEEPVSIATFSRQSISKSGECMVVEYNQLTAKD